MLMQSEIAGVGRRLLATVLDLVILHFFLLVVTRGMVLPPVGMWVMEFVFAVCYSGLFLGLRGQTPGKMALGLRVIGAGEGILMYAQTFKRSFVKWIAIFCVFVFQALLMPSDLQEPVAQDVRVLGSSVVMLVGTIGWLWLVHTTRRHPDGQAWHDRLAKTFVVKLE